jgi:hypothetical protein
LGSLSTRPFIFVPLDLEEADLKPADMSFRKADRVIGQLQMKILGNEIKDDSSTRKVSSSAFVSAAVNQLLLTM